MDHLAGRRERGIIDHRGIDANLGALAQKISDQPVERLVGAVEGIL